MAYEPPPATPKQRARAMTIPTMATADKPEAMKTAFGTGVGTIGATPQLLPVYPTLQTQC